MKTQWTVTKLGRPGNRQYRVLIHFSDQYGRACAYEHMVGNYRSAVKLGAQKAKELRAK